MKISSTSAQQIVEEIGKLVRQNINLMDGTGHIIASNDPARIGNFHPGAHMIITQHLKEMYITPEMERSNTLLRQGINLPIEVDGQVEGVIGITGLYDEVIQYGQIVKKMAEILIKERIAMDEQRLDLRIRTRFLEEWVMGDGLANLQNLSERGFSLGIDISLPRRCVVVSPRRLELVLDHIPKNRKIDYLHRIFPGCTQAQIREFIFPLVAGLIFAKFIGKRVKSKDELAASEGVVKTYEELVAEYGQLPGGFNALAPIVVPVLLMAMGTIGKQVGITGTALNVLNFLGTPIISLAVGTIFAIAQLAIAGKMDEFYNITNDTLKTVGPILFVTAAGGVLGKVISSTSMVSFITENAGFLMNLGIFFPFLLAAILKTAQGSSTVAITTTAGIMAPMMESLGLGGPVMGALTVMAIGAGAMTVSHANDSYFWVVTNFGDMTPDQGYKTQTMLTLVMGVASIIGIFIVSLFF